MGVLMLALLRCHEWLSLWSLWCYEWLPGHCVC